MIASARILSYDIPPCKRSEQLGGIYAKNPSERCEREDFVVYLHRKTLLGGSDETPDKR